VSTPAAGLDSQALMLALGAALSELARCAAHARAPEEPDAPAESSASTLASEGGGAPTYADCSPPPAGPPEADAAAAAETYAETSATVEHHPVAPAVAAGAAASAAVDPALAVLGLLLGSRGESADDDRPLDDEGSLSASEWSCCCEGGDAGDLGETTWTSEEDAWF
jgi:hypothetical protein